MVTAAELTSVAAFLQGKHAQAFPTFGSERTVAPVTAFCRISDEPAVVKLGQGKRFEINYDYCKGCVMCAAECPCGAIEMVPEVI